MKKLNEGWSKLGEFHCAFFFALVSFSFGQKILLSVQNIRSKIFCSKIVKKYAEINFVLELLAVTLKQSSFSTEILYSFST